jgi:RNA polymerase sigma-70 factor, ECF subfamily
MVPFDEVIHAAPTGKPPSEFSREERVQQLHKALSRLPVEYREVLVLRDIEGWSYNQLTSVLNVSSGTVLYRLSRARQRLRQEVAKVEDKASQNEL